RMLGQVEAHLDRLVKRYIPEDRRENFVFHATEIFNGGGKLFKREADPTKEEWPLARRLEIARELAKIPRLYKLPIVVGHVDRRTFPQTFYFPADAPTSKLTMAAHVISFAQCAIGVEHWMRRNTSNEVCMMIVEDNDLSRKMIRDVQLHYQ